MECVPESLTTEINFLHLRKRRKQHLNKTTKHFYFHTCQLFPNINFLSFFLLFCIRIITMTRDTLYSNNSKAARENVRIGRGFEPACTSHFSLFSTNTTFQTMQSRERSSTWRVHLDEMCFSLPDFSLERIADLYTYRGPFAL